MEQLPALPSKGEGTHFSAEQLNIPGGMACQVSSLRGEILARSHTDPQQTLEAEQLGFHDQMIDGAPWRSFTLVRGDLRITTADRQIEREALNMSILLAASVPVGVALLGCLCLLWLGIGQGLAPLNRMRDALMRRSADSLEPLQIQPLPSELQPLLDTQNQLLQRIGKTIERERRLTGDAAHELRSPLTAIKTHLQVARMTEGAARDQSLARAEEGLTVCTAPSNNCCCWRGSKAVCRSMTVCNAMPSRWPGWRSRTPAVAIASASASRRRQGFPQRRCKCRRYCRLPHCVTCWTTHCVTPRVMVRWT